jgi:chitinase
VTLTATVADNLGVTKIEIFDGATKIAEKISNPYAHVIALTSTDNGTKSYTAKARIHPPWCRSIFRHPLL